MSKSLKKEILVLFLLFLLLFCSCNIIIDTGIVSKDTAVEVVDSDGAYESDSKNHWLIDEDGNRTSEESHMYYNSYEVDGSGKYIKECSVCHYKRIYEKIVNIPEYDKNKGMYSLTIYAPSIYDDEYDPSSVKTGSFKLNASESLDYFNSSNSTSKSLDENIFNELIEIKASDKLYLKGNFQDNNPLTFWFDENISKTRFYINEKLKTESFVDTSYIGIGKLSPEKFYAEFKTALIAELKNNYLAEEESIFDIKAWDYDGDGFFRIVVIDFGEGTVNLSGAGISGTAGMYITNNLSNNTSSNQSDMFFVNARFIVPCYYKLNYSVEKCAQTFMTTLSHEYMHYLQDAYWVQQYNTTIHGSSFLLEGLANTAAFYTLKDSNIINFSGQMSFMLNKSKAFYPYLETQNKTSVNLLDYSLGPLFFIYVKNNFGQNFVNEFIKSGEGNIDKATRSILKVPFTKVYIDCLREAFSQANNKTSDYYLFGLTKDIIDQYFSYDGVGEVFTSSNNSYSASNLYQLSFVINKFDKKYNEIYLTGSGFKTFIFFL